MKQTLQAHVVATFGRHMTVRTPDGRCLAARPFGRSLTAVCGDEVRCHVDPHHAELHVVELLPRRTALYRSNPHGGAQAVVANLTQLLVVLAPLPEPDLFVVDRYLCAAASAGIAATLVINKEELGLDALAAARAEYGAAGYACVACSADTGAGLDALLGAIAPEALAVLVGQSGVGKSSLLRRLVPQAEVAIGELVRAEEGRHTTTAAREFALPGGRALIDSPGVRDFAPAVEQLEASTLGFVELGRLAHRCRFPDCAHLREPGCAVRGAAEAGELSARRYESYRRLRRLYQDRRARRGPGRGR